MPNKSAALLIAYVLEKSESDPIATRISTLRALADFLPETDRTQVRSLANDLAAWQQHARQLTLTLTSDID